MLEKVWKERIQWKKFHMKELKKMPKTLDTHVSTWFHLPRMIFWSSAPSKFLSSGINFVCEIHYIHSFLNGIQLLLSVSLCTVCCDFIGSTICLDAPQWIRNERLLIKGLTPEAD